MNGNFEKIAAAIIYCDGDVATQELQRLSELSASAGITVSELSSTVNSELEIIKNFDEEELEIYMQHAAEGIVDEETKYKVFDAMLELILADGVVDDYEIHTLGNLAKYLQVPNYYFAGNLAHKVKEREVELCINKEWEKQEEKTN